MEVKDGKQKLEGKDRKKVDKGSLELKLRITELPTGEAKVLKPSMLLKKQDPLLR
jgi:hypothetical protein